MVGASSALADCPSSLSWTAVGTRLLSVPAAVFARVVGSAPVDVDRAEVDTLLDTAPRWRLCSPRIAPSSPGH